MKGEDAVAAAISKLRVSGERKVIELSTCADVEGSQVLAAVASWRRIDVSEHQLPHVDDGTGLIEEPCSRDTERRYGETGCEWCLVLDKVDTTVFTLCDPGNQEHEAKAQEFEYSGALKQVNDKIHRSKALQLCSFDSRLEQYATGDHSGSPARARRRCGWCFTQSNSS
eukprot:403861-Hanusia_phi.AAC.10